MKPTPTTAELYLAYRCAKLTKWGEYSAAAIRKFAEWEHDLGNELRRLRKALLPSTSWFDELSIGNIWVVPKNQPDELSNGNRIKRIGGSQDGESLLNLSISLHLAGTVEFHIAEVLYLWRFGPVLEKTVSKKAVGNRLRLDRKGAPYREGRSLYQWWPRRYQEFRSRPVTEARRLLKQNGSKGVCWLASIDLTSFYDNVDPSFLTEDRFVEKLSRAARMHGLEFQEGAYITATESLLRAYARFHKTAASITGIPVNKGLPIGALTSPIVANAALAPLDRAIMRNDAVSCYRRYVDDILFVSKFEDEPSEDIHEFLQRLVPCRVEDSARVAFDEASLNRAGSRFIVKPEKTKIFRLEGLEGIDFLNAINADLNRITSERRLLVDPDIVRGKSRISLIGATGVKLSRLRALRDADRIRLERFSLSITISSLLRSTLLLSKQDALEVFSGAVAPVVRALSDPRGWVDNLQSTLRILELAVLVGDHRCAAMIIRQTDEMWSSYFSDKEQPSLLRWGDSQVTSRRARIWLRNYLHERRFEAICKAVPLDPEGEPLPSWLQEGLLIGTKTAKTRLIMKNGTLLSQADLRTRDWEDGDLRMQKPRIDRWLKSALWRDLKLSRRFREIQRFIDACATLRDETWIVSPEVLYLASRPPKYFDVARRILYRADRRKIKQDLSFRAVCRIVNAVRGTRYTFPTGRVMDGSTVVIGDATGRPLGHTWGNPRIMLGNLVLRNDWYFASFREATSPNRSKYRLAQLSELLEKADHVAREGKRARAPKRPALLVLPELALPRAWLRTVANVVVSNGAFGLISGVEYRRHQTKPVVYNQVVGVFPGGMSSVTAWTWTKERPADEEGRHLAKEGLRFESPPVKKVRTVLHSPYGRISVLICSELIEARLISQLVGRADVVLVPSWNTDTASYDHLIASVGLQLHAIVGVANNGHYSDCRAWAPRRERWRRDLCRLIERDVDEIAYNDIPLISLRLFHAGTVSKKDDWKPLPPGYSDP